MELTLSANPQHYTQLDENTAVNTTTGEIVNTKIVSLVEGSIVYTPQDQERYQKKKEIEAVKQASRRINRDLGKFFFAHNDKFDDLSLASITRLIFLNTFLEYKTDRLIVNKNIPMKKSDLKNILGVSKSTSNDFFNEVYPKYLTVDNDGVLHSNVDFFKMNTLTKAQKADKDGYRKFYINGVRTLYKSTKNYKHLGYVFRMLPYINIEYNVLCYNPFETNYKDIDTLTLEDFCGEMGTDTNNLWRLTAPFREIRFNGEKFCSFVNDGKNIKDSKIFINPRIFYSGSDYRKVEVLAIFSKD